MHSSENSSREEEQLHKPHYQEFAHIICYNNWNILITYVCGVAIDQQDRFEGRDS